MTPTPPPSPPDELERFFHRLVFNLAELDRSRLDAPIPLADVHQSLVPYRTHRAALGLETNQDYEMVVLRFLAGERGYARVEPDEVRHALERELRSVNPDVAAFRRYGTATVHLDPDQVRVLLVEREAHPGAFAPRAPGAAADAGTPPAGGPSEPPATGGGMSAEGDEADDLRFSLEEEEPPPPVGRDIPASGVQCSYCGGDLPVGRSVIFCPHCGQNVGVMHCPVCGTELDVGWRFCITCGREAAGLG